MGMGMASARGHLANVRAPGAPDRPPRARALRLLGCVVALGAALTLPGAGHGAQVRGLYEARVAARGEDAEQRGAAIADALAVVLVKVTGDRQVRERKQTAPVLAQASRLVQRYRYQASEAGQGDAPTMLLARFDAAAVDRALRAQGLAVWGATRPSTLLWLAEQAGGQPRLGADGDPALAARVARVEARRGLPVLLPLLDLEDQTALAATDVWNEDQDKIKAASARYEADGVLAGRLAPDGSGGWDGRWTLYQAAQSTRWQSRGSSRDQALGAGLERLVEELVARFAPQAGGADGGGVHLRVARLASMGAYVQVAAYLASLSVVEQAYPVRVEPDSVLFEVRVRGAGAALRQALGLGSMLEPALVMPGPESTPAPGAPGADPPETLYYRLVP